MWHCLPSLPQKVLAVLYTPEKWINSPKPSTCHLFVSCERTLPLECRWRTAKEIPFPWDLSAKESTVLCRTQNAKKGKISSYTKALRIKNNTLPISELYGQPWDHYVFTMKVLNSQKADFKAPYEHYCSYIYPVKKSICSPGGTFNGT